MYIHINKSSRQAIGSFLPRCKNLLALPRDRNGKGRGRDRNGKIKKETFNFKKEKNDSLNLKNERRSQRFLSYLNCAIDRLRTTNEYTIMLNVSFTAERGRCVACDDDNVNAGGRVATGLCGDVE